VQFAEEWEPQLGQTVTLRVIGMAQDERCQAVKVEIPDGLLCLNDNPHITVSCADGTAPKYSNELLAAAELEPLELVLTGTVELVKFGSK